ncbi:hypothetical protein LIER_01635 [Lithospermum erythrorhizon]|uniref:Uncharacterized protein n=1 Tax=Lithospermum erythrorhizon TaxID=34254 RepID=A0AAV3NR73_LITER
MRKKFSQDGVSHTHINPTISADQSHRSCNFLHLQSKREEKYYGINSPLHSNFKKRDGLARNSSKSTKSETPTSGDRRSSSSHFFNHTCSDMKAKGKFKISSIKLFHPSTIQGQGQLKYSTLISAKSGHFISIKFFNYPDCDGGKLAGIRKYPLRFLPFRKKGSSKVINFDSRIVLSLILPKKEHHVSGVEEHVVVECMDVESVFEDNFLGSNLENQSATPEIHDDLDVIISPMMKHTSRKRASTKAHHPDVSYGYTQKRPRLVLSQVNKAGPSELSGREEGTTIVEEKISIIYGLGQSLARTIPFSSSESDSNIKAEEVEDQDRFQLRVLVQTGQGSVDLDQDINTSDENSCLSFSNEIEATPLMDLTHCVGRETPSSVDNESKWYDGDESEDEQFDQNKPLSQSHILICEDFNQDLFNTEKHPTPTSTMPGSLHLLNFLSEFGLEDFPHMGFKFSCTGIRRGINIFEKLNKAMSNFEWSAAFPSSSC